MRAICLTAAALALTSCDGTSTGPAAPGPPAAEAHPSAPDLSPFVGQSYTDLATSPVADRYAADNLPMDDAGKARFARAMSLSAPAWFAEGGGTRALIFVGCEAGACAHAAGILAVDARTGDVYAAVRDGDGQSALIPNDRLEALIEATSPADRWADPDAWSSARVD